LFRTVHSSFQAGSLWVYTKHGSEILRVWIRDKLVVQDLHSTRLAKNFQEPKMLVIASVRKIGKTGIVDYGCHMLTPMIVDRMSLFSKLKEFTSMCQNVARNNLQAALCSPIQNTISRQSNAVMKYR
uniref:RAB3GAP2_N domain-containing protein n=1 Tax=Gongylonema pulchrum TaxID=637853 RepID=A0A183DAK3_9BILA